jgi:hypothetical protein
MTSEREEPGDGRRIGAGLELLDMPCDDIKGLCITIALTHWHPRSPGNDILSARIGHRGRSPTSARGVLATRSTLDRKGSRLLL